MTLNFYKYKDPEIGGALMMIYEDQDLGGSSNEGDNKLSAPINDENFFSIKLNEDGGKPKGRPQSGKSKGFRQGENLNEPMSEQKIFEDFVGMLTKYDQKTVSKILNKAYSEAAKKQKKSYF